MYKITTKRNALALICVSIRQVTCKSISLASTSNWASAGLVNGNQSGASTFRINNCTDWSRWTTTTGSTATFSSTWARRTKSNSLRMQMLKPSLKPLTKMRVTIKPSLRTRLRTRKKICLRSWDVLCQSLVKSSTGQDKKAPWCPEYAKLTPNHHRV